MPGFESALRSGLLPAVPAPPPAPPPAPLPGRSAQAAFRVFLGELAAIVALGLLLVAVAGRVGLSQGWTSVLVLVAGLVGFLLALYRWQRVGQHYLAELEHGYTTLVLQFGGFALGDGRRRPGLGRRVPWNYAGIWVFTPSGEVLSAPEPGVEPPGFYPSPNRPGAFELWTGAVWAGEYRTPRPHL